jgi:hypothetical protein
LTSFEGLPGEDLIVLGLDELARGVEGVGALLIAIGAPRLARAGIPVPERAFLRKDAELLLYALLAERGEPDPYGRYNALIRELVSFERALEHRVRRERAAAAAERNAPRNR